MKISKYTFFFDIENTDFYAYNTLSNALIEIDQESYNILIIGFRTKTYPKCYLIMIYGTHW